MMLALPGSYKSGAARCSGSERKRMNARAWALTLPVVLAAAACEYPDAYVYTPREFDRSSPAFRQVLLDRNSVTVCAPPFEPLDGTVTDLADQACRTVGKNARNPQRRFGVCPLLVASAVVYRCVAPAS